MADNLPKSGVELVAENFDAFIKVMEKANQLIEAQGKKITETAKKSEQAATSTGKFEKGIRGLIQRFTSGNPIFQKAQGVMKDFGIELSALPLKAVAAVAAVAAMAAAFVALGHRGAALVGLAESFDRIAASVNTTSTSLLENLRTAAAGTISDFGLIERANVALSGATGKLGEELGQKLPRLLEIARVQARVTGKDIDFIFNSLIEGIRKASPLRIDNAQLIIKVSEAEKAYAESIGKTVEQLTQEEKGIAILNATLESGNAALAQAGNIQETNAEKIARSTATISNIFDTLAVAVQPGFGAVQDGVNSILAAVENVVKKLAPFLNIIVTIIGTVIGKVLEAFGTIINVVLGLATPFLDGAQAILGAFANGLLLAFNRVVFPVVLAIVTTIADFLVGQSPPPKGPLSKIDEGGANTMLAWLDGFAGVGIQPIEAVTKEVADAMGNVANLGAQAVAKRIAVLDKALLPFQNRLDIVKSQFEAIQAPAEAALNAIDRQIQAATEALARGEEGSAERVRALDAQRQMIQDAVAAQQAQVDAATVQLTLVKAQQAQERALLNIRKAQLPVLDKATKSAKEAVPKIETGKTAAGGAAAVPAAATGGGGIPITPEGPSVLGNFGADIASFLNLNPDELAAFQQNTGALNEQFGRLSDLGAATGGVAGGINKFGKLFDINDPTSPLGTIRSSIENLFNPESPNSIARVISDFGDSLANSPVIQQVSSFFNGIFNPEVVGSPAQILSALVSNLLSATSPDGIIAAFRSFGSELMNLPLVGDVLNFVNSIFSPAILGSPAQVLTDLIDGLVNPEREGSIPYFFSTLPQRISDAASGLFTEFDANVIDPVRNFLTGSGEGTLQGIIDTAVQFFADFPNRVVTALQGFGLFLWASFAVPVINVINSVIGGIEAGIHVIQSSAEQLVNNIAATIGTAQAVLTGNEQAGIETAQNFKAGFGNAFTPVTFGRIPIEPPSFLTGAKLGGLFSGGLLKVGERGEELIGSASKLAVFPNEFVRAVEGLTQMLSGPVPVPIPATSNVVTNNNQRSINATFNGVQGPSDVMRRFASLRAFR